METQNVHIAHAHELSQQGVWLQWRESTVSFDFSWKNLIYGPGPYLVKFVLNASINSVRTPDMMCRWGYKSNASCVLCGESQCTLHHILSNCGKALTLKRYLWRHDSVLKNFVTILGGVVEKWNAKKSQKSSVPPLSSSFVPAGVESKQQTSSRRALQRPCFLDGAQDWNILADFDQQRLVFPPEIVVTALRPDIVLWSTSKRRVLLIELTCPAEEGIAAAALYKTARYAELCSMVQEAGWSVGVRPIEVGARGFVAHSVPRLLKELGMSHREVSTCCRTLAMVVARCSFSIYLAHADGGWQIPPLLSL